MLYLIRGLPGSGKSTFAKELVKRYKENVNFKYQHVEADMFWVRPNGTYDFNFKLLKEAHEWCYNTTKEWLDCLGCVVVSNTFTTQKEIQPYIDMAISMGHSYCIIRCDGNYGSIHNVPEETIGKMKARFVDIEGEVYVEDFKRIYQFQS